MQTAWRWKGGEGGKILSREKIGRVSRRGEGGGEKEREGGREGGREFAYLSCTVSNLGSKLTINPL